MNQQQIKAEFNIDVPMRDGTRLRADLFLPEAAGPFPTVVMRTPYDKSRGVFYSFMDPIRLARNGYAVVMQDCRGCFASEGVSYPWRDEPQDGYDTVEWAAAQPWSNQRVGMYGYSYTGSTQWLAASERPPHLVTIVPASSPISGRDAIFRGGVFQLQLAQMWTLLLGSMYAQRRTPGPELMQHVQKLMKALGDLGAEARHLPVNTWPAVDGVDELAHYHDWLAHPADDAYWAQLQIASAEKTGIPVFVVAGWHDICTAAGSLASYVDITKNGATEAARKHSRLIVGPWGHETHLMQRVGDIDYGLMASSETIDYMGLHIRWFDHWLKQIENGVTKEPPVRLFVMGRNVWRHENEWPLARTQYTRYYLRGGSRTTGQGHDGALSLEPPRAEAPDTFAYDPLDPVPTQGGAILSITRSFGPVDQAAIEQRDDVLVYTTPVLADDVEVTGPVTLTLFARSSAPDTDFTAKLVDVWPDGRAFILLDGIVRARYRDAQALPSLLSPGEVCEYTIDLAATSNVFLAGHCIRLEVSSSNFPKYDRNPNTGDPVGTSAQTRVAAQTLFHDDARPSCLVLPIIPK